MVFILITVLIDMMAIGLIVPVLPLWIGTFTSSPAEQTFWYGVVALSFGATNFVSSPILGALSDRFGRRPVLLSGFMGLALSFWVTGLATALWMLIVVRVFNGAMQANAAVANAYVADITAPADRARRFGLVGAMFGLGFTLGPALGGVLGSIHLNLPFFVAGTMAVLNGLYGYFVLPESLPPQKRRPFSWRQANPFSALRGLGRLRGVGSLVVVTALASLAQFTVHNSFVLYTTFKFGWGPRDNGLALFTVGLMSVLVQGVLLKHLLRRFSGRFLAVGGLLASTCTYLGFGLISEGWMMFAVIVVGSLLGASAFRRRVLVLGDSFAVVHHEAEGHEGEDEVDTRTDTLASAYLAARADGDLTYRMVRDLVDDVVTEAERPDRDLRDDSSERELLRLQRDLVVDRCVILDEVVRDVAPEVDLLLLRRGRSREDEGRQQGHVFLGVGSVAFALIPDDSGERDVSQGIQHGIPDGAGNQGRVRSGRRAGEFGRG